MKKFNGNLFPRIIQSLHWSTFLSILFNSIRFKRILFFLTSMHWQHHRSDWAIIQSHAPHFTSVLEALNERKFNTPEPIDDLPECLNLKSKNTFDSDQEWQQYLDSDVGNGVTTREMYLRVLLAYAVSDQGADIPGVRLFMNHFIKECYSNGVRLFETRPRMGDPVMIRIAFEGANLAFKKRSDIWGRE